MLAIVVIEVVMEYNNPTLKELLNPENLVKLTIEEKVGYFFVFGDSAFLKGISILQNKKDFDKVVGLLYVSNPMFLSKAFQIALISDETKGSRKIELIRKVFSFEMELKYLVPTLDIFPVEFLFAALKAPIKHPHFIELFISKSKQESKISLLLENEFIHLPLGDVLEFNLSQQDKKEYANKMLKKNNLGKVERAVYLEWLED